MEAQTIQGALPIDPMDHVRGSNYLRLTNECPKEGVFLILSPPKVIHNDKFDKDEYQWPIIHYTPHPVEKTLTETSPGFCSALKASTQGNPYGKVLRIYWKKVDYHGRPSKDWSIKIAAEADIKEAFA